MNEQFYEAVSTMVDIALEGLQFDKTVTGKISRVEDASLGKYRVAYQGSEFSAYALNKDEVYKVNDNVLIKIPQGDFSNQKIIEGKVSKNDGITDSERDQLSHVVKDVSPQLLTLVNPEESPYGLIAGVSSPLFLTSKYNFDRELFSAYLAQYSYLRIKASFMTQFIDKHSEGNYGLKLYFNIPNTDAKACYTLDVPQFNGQPYNFITWAPQEAIIQLQAGSLSGLDSIEFFQNMEIDNNNETNANIFVKDIQLSFVDILDLSNEPLYLDILTPRGTIIDNTSLILQGRVLAYGEDISDSNCEYQWYAQDISVIQGDEVFDKTAGAGWRKMHVTSTKEVEIWPQEVAFNTSYKLIVTYNKRDLLFAQVNIFKKNALDYYITQSVEADSVYLEANRGSKFLWILEYPDKTRVKLAAADKKIDITEYLIYPTLAFYCLIDDEATVSYQVRAADNQEDVTVGYDYDYDVYNYLADNSIDNSLWNTGHFLKPFVKLKDNVASSYELTVYLGNEQITSTPKSPDGSMMYNIRVDNNYLIYYNINKSYSVSKRTNNTFTIRVKFINGQEYEFHKPIVFSKDGDQGTNGTSFMAYIVPWNNGEITEYRPFNYPNDAIAYRCLVYKDGDIINSESANNGYTFKYIWDKENVDINTSGGIAAQTVVTSINDTETFHYIKVQITITDTMDSSKSTSLYAFYPIDVLVGSINNPDVSTIPSYIKYNAGGENPSFSDTDLSFVYDNGKAGTLEVIGNKSLLAINNGRLRPISKFYSDYSNNMGAIKCIADNNNYIVHTVIMYLDIYGNKDINGWDGTKLEIDSEGNYIFAPQVGAGEKVPGTNIFNGLVLGKRGKNDNRGSDHWGLYAFDEQGRQTVSITDQGIATFGSTSKGQIVVDGTKATITGGGGGSSTGMTLRMDSNGSDSTKGIQLGNDKFWVKYDGSMKSTSGTIGGWIIGENTLKSASGKVTLNSNGSISATDVDLQGDIKADTGYIGNWTIDNGAIYYGKSYDNSPTKLTSTGRIESISGKIGGWTISDTALSVLDNNGAALIKLDASPKDNESSILITGTTPDASKTNNYILLSPTEGIKIRGKAIADTFKIGVDENEIGTLGRVTGKNGQSGVGITNYGSHPIIIEADGADGRFTATGNAGLNLEGTNVKITSNIDNTSKGIVELAVPTGSNIRFSIGGPSINLVNREINGVGVWEFPDIDYFYFNGHKPYAYFA